MPPTAPLAQRQDVFVSSVDLRSGGYLKPFGVKDYYRFIKDPRWRSPFGPCLFNRASISELFPISSFAAWRRKALPPKTAHPPHHPPDTTAGRRSTTKE